MPITGGSIRQYERVPEIEDVERRTFDLLRANVRAEVLVQNGMWSLGLSDETVDRLAESIAVNVDYAFSIRWSPDWVKDGDLHQWDDDGEHFARCPECLIDSPASPSEPAARAWVAEHRRVEHHA